MTWIINYALPVKQNVPNVNIAIVGKWNRIQDFLWVRGVWGSNSECFNLTIQRRQVYHSVTIINLFLSYSFNVFCLFKYPTQNLLLQRFWRTFSYERQLWLFSIQFYWFKLLKARWAFTQKWLNLKINRVML